MRHASLDEIIETADVISLNCPLTPETANMIDAKALARMKRSAVLINVARGGVVNEQDLCEALKNGVIRGAAMDVFSIEPRQRITRSSSSTTRSSRRISPP